MFDLLSLNLDKLMQTFLLNLELKVKSPFSKKYQAIRFLSHVEDMRRTKYELYGIAEKLKNFATRRNLNFSNEQAIKCFIEEQTNFVDKLVYLGNRPIAEQYLRNINKKILQRILESRRVGTEINTIKAEVRTGRKCAGGIIQSVSTHVGFTVLRNACYMFVLKANYKFRCIDSNKKNVGEECKHSLPERKSKECLERKRVHFKHSSRDGISKSAREELELAQKFLWLYTKEVEFIMNNVHATLHVSMKELNRISEAQYDQIVLLCHRAILCLIEPSDSASVYLESDLSAIIQDQISRGYYYHFDSQRTSTGPYRAVLILSHWARVLVKHSNTSMIRTICGILHCNARDILILSYTEDCSTL